MIKQMNNTLTKHTDFEVSQPHSYYFTLRLNGECDVVEMGEDAIAYGSAKLYRRVDNDKQLQEDLWLYQLGETQNGVCFKSWDGFELARHNTSRYGNLPIYLAESAIDSYEIEDEGLARGVGESYNSIREDLYFEMKEQANLLGYLDLLGREEAHDGLFNLATEWVQTIFEDLDWSLPITRIQEYDFSEALQEEFGAIVIYD